MTIEYVFDYSKNFENYYCNLETDLYKIERIFRQTKITFRSGEPGI